MFCRKCGKQIEDDSLFCEYCGTKIPESILRAMQTSMAKEEVEEPQAPELAEEEVEEPNVSEFPEETFEEPGEPEASEEFYGEGAEPEVSEEFYGEEVAPEFYEEEIGAEEPMEMDASGTTGNQNSVKPPKNRKLIGLAACVVVAAAVAFFAVRTLYKPTINLNDYVTVSCSGYDSVGTASVSVDYEKLADDYGEKFVEALEEELSDDSSVSGLLSELGGSLTAELCAEEFWSSCVEVSLSTTSGLSNGDVITYIWDCDDKEALETFGYKLKYSEEETAVEDLTAAATFDPFEGISVSFSGIAPNGTASIENTTSGVAGNLEYSLSKWEGLSNEETVTVTVTAYSSGTADLETYCLENYGAIPTATEKSFTVTGLSTYVSSLAEISEDCLNQMKAQAEDIFQADMAQTWGEGETLSALTYIGDYLLVAKNGASTDSVNTVYLVYKVQVLNEYSNPDEETETKKSKDEEAEPTEYSKTNTYYWFVRYTNLTLDASGTVNVENIMNYSTPEESFTIDSGVQRQNSYGNMGWEYEGYQTLDELYKDVVSSQVDVYNHEDAVDENPTTEETTAETAAETTQAAETTAAPTEAETAAPTEATTAAPTEATTAATTDATTTAPTEATTAVPTEATTAAPTEATTTAQAVSAE